MKHLNKTGLAIALAAMVAPASVFGHAISIGYENSGPGSVTIWVGTYQHGGHHLEGSLNLVGVGGNPFPSTTVAYTQLVGAGTLSGGGKPAGLVDGVSNFYIPSTTGSGALVGTEAGFNASCPACGPVNHWQGVTFTGLGAGSYQFTYIAIANPSAEWTPLNSALNGVFDLSGVVQPSGVPDAGSTLALLSMGLGVFGVMRRRIMN